MSDTDQPVSNIAAQVHGRTPRLHRGLALLYFVLCFLIINVVGIIDFITGNEYDISILYFVPIAIGSWFLPSAWGIVLTVMSVLTWFAADAFSHHRSTLWIEGWNAIIQLISFFIIAVVVARERNNRARNMEMVARLAEEVSDHKKAKIQLEEQGELLAAANVQLQQFAHVASHDMREPVRTITCFLEIVRERYLGKVLDKQADSLLQEALSGSRRITTLINSTLKSVTAAPKRYALEVLSEADAALDEALKNLSLKISETGAVIERDKLPAVYIEHMRLVQVFQNLIDNAIKFSRQKPCKIRVSATTNNDHTVCISVADNGPGIDPAEVEKIFEMYARGTNAIEGNGIGLATCHRAVQQAGGRMWVESTPGSGSTFRFTLSSPAARGSRSSLA